MGRTHRFVGTNIWYGAYLGATAPHGNRDRLRKELDALSALGVTNLRVLAASELSPLKKSLTTTFRTKTTYNEICLEGSTFSLPKWASAI